MYHNKKIAVFISHIYGDYQSKLCVGITRQADKLGYPVEFYTTNDGENLGSYGLGEESILKIPSLNDISGFIFASGTYVDEILKEKITEYLKDSCLPVIEVNESTSSFPRIYMENNEAAGEITSHMIKVHGSKRICYLGHKNDPDHSEKREQAYKRALVENDIPVSDKNIYICDESTEDFIRALESFTKEGKPDAVIAYNDIVAIGFMDQALKAGYTIPEDFAITGCDNTDGGQNITPKLTTVAFPMVEVGCKAVDALVKLISKEDFKETIVKAEPIYCQSCGCIELSHTNNFEYFRNRSLKISELERSMLLSMKMSTALSHAQDIDFGCDIIADFVKDIHEVKELYMCLYPDWNRISNSVLSLAHNEVSDDDLLYSCDANSILLKLGMKNGKRIPECSFSNSSILPPFVSTDDNRAFVIAPLFFENRAFGYIAMSLQNGNVSYPFQIVQWITNIAQFLQNAYESEYTNILSKKLEDIYLKDNLTGLLNRHGFDKIYKSNARNTKYTTLAFFDLDRLKQINDTYGHDEGDFALKAIAQAISKATEEGNIAARFGGDEFYSILYHDEKDYAKEYIENVNRFLTNFTALSEKPYSISASSGFETIESVNLNELSDLFKAADVKMYESKRNRIR